MKTEATEQLIDGCFYVKHQRWGTVVSVHKDGRQLITSLNEEICINATRWHLKSLQDGSFCDNGVVYSGGVGGKL